ncbi:MAG TPA: LLM class flavin-dependent oxidoreductase [Ktedonobacteraceae bacterium]|nr:LLM class flavin-dependent oxidoreductase [Ktedonobacteraceae bacterium]
MPRIQFGWTMPSGVRDPRFQKTLVADTRKGLEMVAGRFDSAWFVDHLQTESNQLLEGWTAITYMSALYPQFQFGHAVLCQSFRNPALLAKMAATLQFMSGGRFILGIGAGWKEDEYTAYGYDFPVAGVRVEELEETLQIIKAMWQNERATFEGKHYRVVNAWCEPKPDPLPPVMIGGAKPRMLRLIARHADWWNVSWTTIENYRPQVVECERACEEIGRDPATLRRTWFGGCICAPTEDRLKALNKMGLTREGGAFVGTPSQIADQMRPFIDLGVDYFMLSSGGFPDLTTLDMLVNEVLPAVNR